MYDFWLFLKQFIKNKSFIQSFIHFQLQIFFNALYIYISNLQNRRMLKYAWTHISSAIALYTQSQVTCIPTLHFDTVRSAQCKTKYWHFKSSLNTLLKHFLLFRTQSSINWDWSTGFFNFQQLKILFRVYYFLVSLRISGNTCYRQKILREHTKLYQDQCCCKERLCTELRGANQLLEAQTLSNLFKYYSTNRNKLLNIDHLQSLRYSIQ